MVAIRLRRKDFVVKSSLVMVHVSFQLVFKIIMTFKCENKMGVFFFKLCVWGGEKDRERVKERKRK